MGIFIRKPETEAKIRELAARTGQTLTDAVEQAVDERLARTPVKKGRIDRAKLAALLAEVSRQTRVNEGLTDDEIVGYDEFGVPR